MKLNFANKGPIDIKAGKAKPFRLDNGKEESVQ